jgi:hypothetical protein
LIGDRIGKRHASAILHAAGRRAQQRSARLFEFVFGDLRNELRGF